MYPLKTIITSALTFVICVLLVGCGLSRSSNTAAQLDAYVQAYADRGFFSGAVLVAKEGKILLSKGYGMANYEFDIPNTPQTKFRLGSITKQFTSMAVMQLQEKGLLNVHDPLSKYIPDYPRGSEITIYHLLTHTAGIPNVTAFAEYKREKIQSHTPEQLIELFKHKPLEFEPGAKHAYSNSGYMLLTYIIEKASGKSYETVLKENIFDPLGMKNSGYDHASIILKNRASGYSLGEDGLVNATYIDMSFPLGGGGLYSTVEDLYLWDQALYTEKLASQKSLDEIFTPCKNEYGCGWCVGKRCNRKRMGHGGGIDGFSTDIARYPDDHLCIIVLSNFEHTSRILPQSLPAIVFGEKYELPQKYVEIAVNPEIYDQYVGRYGIERDDVHTFTKENNTLFLQPPRGSKEPLFPESETKFFSKIVDAQFSFIKDKRGKVSKVILHQHGKDFDLEKAG